MFEQRAGGEGGGGAVGAVGGGFFTRHSSQLPPLSRYTFVCNGDMVYLKMPPRPSEHNEDTYELPPGGIYKLEKFSPSQPFASSAYLTIPSHAIVALAPLPQT